jgi:hypothetical protein
MSLRSIAACLALMFLLPAVLPALAAAGPHPDAKLIMHLVPVPERRMHACLHHGVETFDQVVTAGDVGTLYYAYILVADIDTTEGMAGVQFGISYDGEPESGIEILEWHPCAFQHFPEPGWPSSETGNLLTWSQDTACQTKVPVVVGYLVLRADSPDRLKLIPRPVDDIAQLAACGVTSRNADTRVDHFQTENLGWLDFGEGEGYNPWDPEQNLLNISKTIRRSSGN